MDIKEYKLEKFGDNFYVSRGRFSASLACLEGSGCLVDGDREIEIPVNIIEALIAKAGDQY